MSEPFTTEHKEVVQTIRGAARAIAGKDVRADLTRIGLNSLAAYVEALNAPKIRGKIAHLALVGSSYQNNVEIIAGALNRTSDFYEKYSCQQTSFDFV